MFPRRRSGPSPRSGGGGGGGRYRATSGRSGAGDPTVSSSGKFNQVNMFTQAKGLGEKCKDGEMKEIF